MKKFTRFYDTSSRQFGICGRHYVRLRKSRVTAIKFGVDTR